MKTEAKYARKLSLPVLAAALLPVIFMIGACASVDKDAIQADLSNAQMAVEKADRFDADDHAALELRVAEEKLSQARAAFSREDYRQAGWLADEALVNAQLVEVKAQSAETQNAVDELKKAIDTLKSETRRLQES